MYTCIRIHIYLPPPSALRLAAIPLVLTQPLPPTCPPPRPRQPIHRCSLAPCRGHAFRPSLFLAAGLCRAGGRHVSLRLRVVDPMASPRDMMSALRTLRTALVSTSAALLTSTLLHVPAYANIKGSARGRQESGNSQRDRPASRPYLLSHLCLCWTGRTRSMVCERRG